MQRDLAGLERSSFDLAIIGGGIVGAAIARDAARRGLSVALIEMNDFGSAASEAMSRMIHGGLRYLAQGRFGLVRETLAERAVWMRTAPGFIKPQPFILPLTQGYSSLKIEAAAAFYERLAGRKAAYLTRSEAVNREPVLDGPALSGAVVYQDARIDDPHRLVLAILQDAAACGAALANHVKCTGLWFSGGKLIGLRARDLLSDLKVEVRAASVINAAGPWAQDIANTLVPGQVTARLTASRGVHMVTKSMTGNNAIALSGDGEHGFVLPWLGMSLVGTSDDPCGLPDGGGEARPEELERLKEKIGRLLPASIPFLDAPLGSYAAARAIPGETRDTYRAAREIAFCDHAADGANGFFSVFGGKWTTARSIAETVVDHLALRAGRRLNPCDTREEGIAGPAHFASAAHAIGRAKDHEMAVTTGDVWRRLGRKISYGDAADRIEVERLLASKPAAREMERTGERGL